MAIKRIILANNSRLLREMLQRVINKADRLEVVQEIRNQEELSSTIERFDPEWVILSTPQNKNGPNWVETCVTEYPGVRFILFSPDHNSIKMKWQATYEEDLTNLSLKDFIHILEKDLQHIQGGREII